VARIYAGILGLIAFLTSLAHGMVHGGAAQSVLWIGWCSLLVFSAVGCAIGWIAEQTIEDSVRGQVETELAARDAADPAAND